MNFFEEQAKARRNTGLLVFLFALAVVCLIAFTSLVAAVLLGVTDGANAQPSAGAATPELTPDAVWRHLDWPLVSGIALVVLAVVVLGSLFKRLQLNAGGRAVAEALGGRLINTNTQDADERKMLNVVEEMAIAAGMPVPPVYVLEDESINAFAAGSKLNDAVMGVTRGSIRNLSRSELQGVVAHEFSHIMHGDMRLNLRLVSILHGVLIIGLLGQMVLYSMRFRRMGGGRRDNSVMALLAFGVALMVIGYAGTFFGNLIKAAVSRQREFLADASAVQFTRYPESIGGALIKIGAHAKGSELASSHAPEFSHMYFGQGVKLSFNRMMATHPPLEQRIKAVMPDWDGRFTLSDSKTGRQDDRDQTSSKDSHRDARKAVVGALAAGQVLSGRSVDEAMDAMGQPGDRHLDYARNSLNELSESLRDAAHEPFAARALIYALLLSDDVTVREQQWTALRTSALPDVYRELERLADDVVALPAYLRLPLLGLTVPALKELSASQYKTFKHCMAKLIRADGRFSLSEWALHRFVIHAVEAPDSGAENKNLKALRPACEVLITCLARAGHTTETEVKAAVTSASEVIGFDLMCLPENAAGVGELDKAVQQLRRLKPLAKPALLKAMARCIEHSGQMTTHEAELFRTVAEVLDCPMPPLMKM